MKVIKRNAIIVFLVALFTFLALGVLTLTSKGAKAEELSGFSVSEYATVETDSNGDKLLKFKTTVGSDFLSDSSSSVYSFGTIIYPTANGDIDNSKTPFENKEALDGVNIIATSSGKITEGFTYNASILFDKETLTSWVLSKKPELEGDEEGLATALSKVYENLYAKNFTAVSYAVTDNGVIYSSNQSTSATSSLEYSTEGVVYFLYKDYAVVAAYFGKSKDIVIASQYKGYPVTTISESFCGLQDEVSSIGSLTIPSSVTTIERGAFGLIESIEKVNYMGTVDQWAQIDFGDKFSNPLYYTETKNLYINDVLVTEVNLTSATKMSIYAFYDCDSITSVAIGGGITSIGDDAFNGCDSITDVMIGDSVTSIGDGAFQRCYRLTTVTFGENSQLTSIGDGAFYNCASLAKLIIPERVTSIGKYAFEYCFSLTSIIIPDSVVSIGKRALNKCDSLADIEVGNNNNIYKSVGGSLYSKEGFTLIQYALGRMDSSFTIPDGVSNIAVGAFAYSEFLTSVTIGNDVKSIEKEAFYNCSSLVTVAFEDNSQLTSIGDYAFSDCSKLASIEIPSGVTSIDNYAFCECSSLAAVAFEDNSQLTSIGDYAFELCSLLTSIEIPSSVISIGDSAFEYCSSLMSIDIPNSVTSIGYEAFNNCRSLKYNVKDNLEYLGNSENLYLYLADTTSIYITSATIDNNCRFIGDWAFYGCDSLTSIEIPNSVTSIGSEVFAYCDSLAYNVKDNLKYLGNSVNPYLYLVDITSTDITSVTIDDNCRFIGWKAFYNCYSLESIKIPDSVVSISSYAFYNCSSLTSITIPDGVKSIGYEAFRYCGSLETIEFEGTVAQWNEIEKSYTWNDGVPATKVICSDGEVEL
ncbi:MAG: leucine-rich repeat domain-containing protein [Clostridia bacterium]|nr:leucine-rich repeat domain-containing protein [Clostridia bacterium]